MIELILIYSQTSNYFVSITFPHFFSQMAHAFLSPALHFLARSSQVILSSYWKLRNSFRFCKIAISFFQMGAYIIVYYIRCQPAISSVLFTRYLLFHISLCRVCTPFCPRLYIFWRDHHKSYSIHLQPQLSFHIFSCKVRKLFCLRLCTSQQGHHRSF